MDCFQHMHMQDSSVIAGSSYAIKRFLGRSHLGGGANSLLGVTAVMEAPSDSSVKALAFHGRGAKARAKHSNVGVPL